MVLDRVVTNSLSIGFDIYNCIVCVLMMGSLIFSKRKNKSTMYLILLIISIFIFNIADLSNWTCEGLTPAWHVPALHILTFVYFIIVPFCFYFYIKYVGECVKENIRPFVLLSICVTLLYFVGVVLSESLPWGFFYHITEENIYTRGDFQFIAMLFYFVFYIECVAIIIIYNSHFTFRTAITLLSFTVLPVSTLIIQMFIYGLSLVNTGMTVSILLVYINIHKSLETTLEQTTIAVKNQESKLFNMEEHMIVSLSNLVENRDTDTGEHAKRTSLYIGLLARKCLSDGYYTDILNENYINLLVKAAPMHDIGKISTSDMILKKPAKLTYEEFEIMKKHTINGGRIVRDIVGITQDKEYIQIAVDIAQSHHEWWDGTGYPEKLKGEQIPLSARFMAIADVFDALISARCYKQSFSSDRAFEIILQESGSHFDPILVAEFLSIKEEILKVAQEV